MWFKIWYYPLPLIPVSALSVSTEYSQWCKGQFQDHTEWLKHSLCYSRCSPSHKIFFSYPTIFHLKSVASWIHLQFWLVCKRPEWALARHPKHSWLSRMMHFSMATGLQYQRLFLLMNLGPQRVQIKYSHGYTSCCSLTGWRGSLLILYSSTWLTGIYYSCHHPELDVEINGVKRRLPHWFKFSGEKNSKALFCLQSD